MSRSRRSGRGVLASFEAAEGVPLCVVVDNPTTVVGRHEGGGPVWNYCSNEMMPRLSAMVTACVRSLAPSFASIAFT